LSKSSLVTAQKRLQNAQHSPRVVPCCKSGSWIYLEFCFQTWCERVTSVEDDGNGLHVKNIVMGAHVLYHPFPTMQDFSDDDRAAVAVHANCEVGMMAMWEIVKVIFQGKTDA